MNIRRKFTLILSSTFVVALLAMSLIAYSIFYGNAHKEINERARLMLEAATAMRTYTTDHVKSLISNADNTVFHPETVPAFAAMTAFDLLRKDNKNYTYRETALNPTRLTDLPADWEHDIIQKFRDFPEVDEISGTRSTPTGDIMFIAKPIAVGSGKCLECHSTPDKAPASMIKTYGFEHGFGWKQDEVVGARIVAVPTSVSIERAHSTFLVFIFSIAGVAILALVVLDFTLRRIVITPISTLNTLCDTVSRGDFSAADPPTQGDDEITGLGRSFVRMKISLQKALSMLKD